MLVLVWTLRLTSLFDLQTLYTGPIENRSDWPLDNGLRRPGQ
jgi:hypothetical protein